MSSYRATEVEALRARVAKLRRGTPHVMGHTKIDGVVGALRWMADDDALHAAIAAQVGLSAPMVRWAIATSVNTVTAERVDRVRDQLGLDWESNQLGLVAVVLGANVFTAGLKPVLWPLLLGAPVIVKASRRDDVFVHALAERLPEPFRSHVGVETFGHEDALLDALLEGAELVHAYGGDDAVRAVRDRTPHDAVFVPHGHGYGYGLVLGGDAGELEQAAQSFALDVLAYDQRGCLSPREILVVGGAANAERFAIALRQTLDLLLPDQPMGPLDDATRGALARWEATMAALGEVHEGPGGVVAVVDTDARAPATPGARRVVVRPVPSADEATARLRAHGRRLKCVGWAGPLPKTTIPLPPLPGAPRICPASTMQTPTFTDRHEGREPWLGLVRR